MSPEFEAAFNSYKDYWQGNSNSAVSIDSNADFGHSDFGDFLSGQYGAKEQANRQSYLDTQEWLRNEASAKEQRAFEEYMDSTKVQRTMADLKAAGLNPWLAVQSAGFGGSTPVGASASSSAGQVSSSGSSSLAGIGSAAIGIAALAKLIAKILK